MKFGDEVLYVEKGVEYKAVVQRAFILDERAGQNDEPVITLAFFAAPFRPEYRYDVHHESKGNAGAFWKELPPLLAHDFDAAMADIRGDASAFPVGTFSPIGQWKKDNADDAPEQQKAAPNTADASVSLYCECGPLRSAKDCPVCSAPVATTASADQLKADSAQAKADTAQDKADDALGKHKAAAQDKADAAQDKADAAQDKADKSAAKEAAPATAKEKN